VNLRILFVLFCICLCRAATAASTGTDELWETTIKFDMGGMQALPGGMAMPPMTMKSCSAKGTTLDPKSWQKDNSDCTFYDTQISGNRATYKFKCTGQAQMEGTGEGTRIGNTIKGSQRASFQGHDMVQNFEGHIVGTCNVADEKAATSKRIADAKASSAAVMAGLPTPADMDAYKKKICDEAITDTIKTGGTDTTKGAIQDGQYCTGKLPVTCPGARSTALTYEGYTTYRQAVTFGKEQGNASGWVVAACNIDLDKTQATVCRKATSEKNYKFISDNCAAAAKALRAENCGDFAWGFSGDTPDKANYAICTALGPGPGAADRKAGTAESRQAVAPAADKSAVEKATDSIVDKAKSLKGLLGF
jgi:hypothetical protein